MAVAAVPGIRETMSCHLRRLSLGRFLILGLLGMTLLPGPALAAEPPHRTCQTRSTTFEGWAAEELSNQWLQVTIVKQLGGRLMQVSFAGHPYLFVNPKYKGKYIPPEQANGHGSTTEEISSGLCRRGTAMNSTGPVLLPISSTMALTI